MSLNPLPPEGDTYWYDWAESLHAGVNSLLAGLESISSRLSALESGGLAQTTTVTASPGNASVVVNWTESFGSTGYTVAVEPIVNGGAQIPSVTKTAAQFTHSFTGLTNGIGYRATVTIQPSGAQRSVSFTPTAGAAPVTLSVVPGDGQVAVNWSGAADATGYLVGRNGTDSVGSGPWETTDPADARSRTFLNLVNGTTYTFSVTSLPGGVAQTITGTPVAGTAPVVVAPPAGAGTVWLSGAGDDNAGNTTGGGFGNWRGEPATYARAWMDASIGAMEGMYMMDPYRAANWNGIIDLAIGGPRDGRTWATAATGSMDATWRLQCQKINSAWWPNLKGVHISMAHEMSGNWYPWSVNAGNVSSFKTAWRRFYNIVGEELKSKGRNVDVVLCYNMDTVSDITVQAIDPGVAYYDILGVDFYNMWWGGTAASGLNTQATWDANLNAMKGTSPKGIGAWFTYAANQGKALSVPEWGTSPQATVEAPLFVTNMRNLFASKAPVDPYNPGAGRLAGDAYFNTWAQCRLYPTSSVPNTATTYRNLKWGSV